MYLLEDEQGARPDALKVRLLLLLYDLTLGPMMLKI
jgi:hypothetical protein